MNPEDILINQKNICSECGDFLPNHYLTCSQFNENTGGELKKEIISEESASNNFYSKFEKERVEKIDYFANQLNLKIVQEIEPLIGNRKELPDEKEKNKIKLILEKIVSHTLSDAPHTFLKEIFAKIITLEAIKDIFEEIKEKILKKNIWGY